MRNLLPLAVLLSLCLLPTVSSGHDIENTHVLITFSPDGNYQIDILNDPDWMWLRLVGSDTTLPAASERDRQLATLADRFAQSVALLFNGTSATITTIEYVPPSAPAAADDVELTEPGLMRLNGPVPVDASTVQFGYDLIEDPYPLTMVPPSGSPVTRWLEAVELSEAFAIAMPRPMTRIQVSRQYLGLGFLHILPRGLDHILFVLGLFLLSPRLKPLLLQVTVFTLAHTITLGLTVVGVFSLPAYIVEPLIAISIAYVAVENIVTTELSPWRVALVFAFGLLHGMGFAGVLADLGLPRSEFLTALVTFNLGVEMGQLTVIGISTMAVMGVFKKDWYRRRVTVPASFAIAAAGFYWTFERLFF